MKYKLAILLIFFLVGMVSCSVIWVGSLPGCPVDTGDRVERRNDGKIGSVVSIDAWGRRGDNCRIAVHHEDGSITEDFVYNWHYSKL